MENLTDEQLKELVGRIDQMLWDLTRETRVDPVSLFAVVLGRYITMGIRGEYVEQLMGVIEHCMDDFIENIDDYMPSPTANDNVEPVLGQVIKFPVKERTDDSAN